MRLTKIQKHKNKLAEQMITSAFEHGYIKESDLNRKTFLKKIKGYTPRGNDNYLIGVTYFDVFLYEAKKYTRTYPEFALAFYIMYFEHYINQIFSLTKERKKLSASSKEIETILRSNLLAKFYLLPFLGLPIFSREHLKTIQKVNNLRNNFVHYKFVGVRLDEWKKEKEKIKLYLTEIPKVVNYAKKYRSTLLYQGSKDKLRKFIKNNIRAE